MKQSEKDILAAYIYNNYVRLENNLHTLRNNIRYRKIDVTDCMELQLAIQEFETFKEVTKHIQLLLNLKESGCSYADSEKES